MTIRFVAAKYDDSKPYWDDLIKTLEAENPGYRVELEVVDWEQLDSKVRTYKDVVSRKVLADFLPLFANQAQYERVLYGLPFISSARLIIVLTAAGWGGPVLPRAISADAADGPQADAGTDEVAAHLSALALAVVEPR